MTRSIHRWELTTLNGKPTYRLIMPWWVRAISRHQQEDYSGMTSIERWVFGVDYKRAYGRPPSGRDRARIRQWFAAQKLADRNATRGDF